MKQHVVSLELAKQLKEAGYPNNTLWYWAVEMYNGYETDRWSLAPTEHLLEEHVKCPAPLTDEILAQLPHNIKIVRLHDATNQAHKVGWFSVWLSKHPNSPVEKNKSLPDALAKMWLYLKKDGKI